MFLLQEREYWIASVISTLFYVYVYRTRCTHSAPARTRQPHAKQDLTTGDIENNKATGRDNNIQQRVKMLANANFVHSKPILSRTSSSSGSSSQSFGKIKTTTFIETGKPTQGYRRNITPCMKNGDNNPAAGHKKSALISSIIRPHTVASNSIETSLPSTSASLKRSWSNPRWNNSLPRSEDCDTQYYQPMCASRRRRTKSVQSVKPKQAHISSSDLPTTKHGM